MTDDVRVANRRLDASGNEALIGMARRCVDAFGYKTHLRIDSGLAQRLRLRVSQLNNVWIRIKLAEGALSGPAD